MNTIFRIYFPENQPYTCHGSCRGKIWGLAFRTEAGNKPYCLTCKLKIQGVKHGHGNAKTNQGSRYTR